MNFKTKVNSVLKFDNQIRRAKNTRLIGASALAIFALLSILTVAPVSHEPDSAEAIGTESSTTITLAKANADLLLTTVSSDGTFASSSASEMAQFGVKTTNYTGYTLSITASDNTGTLTNTDTSITTNNTFSSISSVIDEKTFDDSSYNGYWGYKPSKMKSVENVGFWPSPTTTATTLDVTESANPSTTNNYTIALGARADYTQATGTYSKTMTLSATANPTPYSVTYNDNTGDSTVTNLPDVSGSATNATQITLSSVTPSRTGYVFAGWCDVAPTNSGKTCSGNTYAKGGSYPIDQTTTNVITLYATWGVPEYDITIKTATGIDSVSLNGTSCSSTSGCTVSDLVYGQSYNLTATATTGYTFSGWYVNGAGSVASSTTASTTFTVGEGEATITANARYTMPAGTTMQGFTQAMCNAMPEEQAYVLTDTRDNTMYTVAKLKDGKCWMTQNLKLGAKDSSLTLTTDDSNVASGGFTLDNKLAEGVFPYEVEGNIAFKNDSVYYCTDSFGCYYNWYTATAGSGKRGSVADATPDGASVDYSICPKGWVLPTGGSGGDFQILVNAYGGANAATAMRMLVSDPTVVTENINGQYSPGFLLGGLYKGDGGSAQNSSAIYWSRTAAVDGVIYHNYLNQYGAVNWASDPPSRGLAVRCLLQ